MQTLTIPRVYDRIQLHPATDQWMRGERFGEFLGVTRNGFYRVRMDSGNIYTVSPNDVL
jgi:hypothetical protein